MDVRKYNPNLLPVYFFLLGSIVFLIYNQFQADQKDKIIVSRQVIDALVQRNQELNPNPLTDGEVEQLIQGYVDDEVLIREARKAGIDQSDGRVRQRMLQVMRTTISENVADPTYAELQAFFEETIDRYTSDSARSFVQVYFDFTNEDIPPLDPEMIERLNSTNDLTSIGDYFATGNRFPEYSFRQTAAIFGRSFTERLFEAEINQWYGPIDSNYGKHFIYVFGIHKPKVAKFEEVESYLLEDYLFQKTRDKQQEKIEQMKTNYEIVIEDEDN